MKAALIDENNSENDVVDAQSLPVVGRSDATMRTNHDESPAANDKEKMVTLWSNTTETMSTVAASNPSLSRNDG